MIWKKTRQVVQTAGAPPASGSNCRPISGCTRNASAAATKRLMAKKKGIRRGYESIVALAHIERPVAGGLRWYAVARQLRIGEAEGDAEGCLAGPRTAAGHGIVAPVIADGGHVEAVERLRFQVVAERAAEAHVVAAILAV